MLITVLKACYFESILPKKFTRNLQCGFYYFIYETAARRAFLFVMWTFDRFEFDTPGRDFFAMISSEINLVFE